MKYNNITFPGDTFMRLLRLVKTGKSMYDFECISKKHTLNKKSCEIINIIQDLKNDKVNQLFRRLKNYSGVVTCLLHGSWADGTNNEFSDIDDIVIIDDSRINLKDYRKIVNILNQIDMQFCRIDPLQHHGHWIVSKTELHNYDNSFMPKIVFENSKYLFGIRDIQIKINQDVTNDGLIRNIKTTLNTIDQYSHMLSEGSINLYELKGLVGSFALMPSFVFQLSNVQILKQDAIARSSEIYSKEALCSLDWASEMRSNWGMVLNDKRFKRISELSKIVTNPHIWRLISKRFMPIYGKLKCSENMPILDLHSVKLFVEESKNYIKKYEEING